jgi:hypothetical protein
MLIKESRLNLYETLGKAHAMKVMIAFTEKSHGSALEYENAQKRILEVFSQFKFPDSFKILSFVVKVGVWDGYILAETDDLAAVQMITTIYPAFRFEVQPVIDIQDAVAAEMSGMNWRAGLKLA